MKIGIAGSMTLELLNFDFKNAVIPKGYPFPLISLLINGLLEKGHSVVAYTCAWNIEKPIVYESEQLTICIAPRLAHAGRRFFDKEREYLTQLMKEYPADLINAQWTYEFAQAAIDSKTPTVITVRDHALTILKYEMNVYTLMRYFMNRRVLRMGKYFIANSDYLKELLSKKNQITTRVISNFFQKDLDKQYNTNQLKENYILSIANHSPKRKNLINGIRGFALLRKKFPDLKYYIIGAATEEGSWIHKKACQEKIETGVEFLGRKSFEQVVEYIKKAKCFLHTSLEETFGNVVLESMVIGTPVVGGDKSGNVPHLLGHGKLGKLCNMKNPHDIASTIETILSNQEIYSTLCKNAHQFAIEHFSQEKVLEKLIQYYQDILAEKTH